jgi:hypothetical protein
MNVAALIDWLADKPKMGEVKFSPGMISVHDEQGISRRKLLPKEKEQEAMNDRLRTILRRLQREGCLVEKTKKHIKVRLPDGRMFTCSSTPSCPYAGDNLLRDIRKFTKEKNNG